MKIRLLNLMLLSLVALQLISTVVYAAPSDLLAQQIGVDSEKLDQIKDIQNNPELIKEEYLKQSWSELIQKNKYLNPVHNFLLKISPVFLVLFGENYSLSMILLFVIILWTYVSLELTVILESLGMLNSWVNRGIAVGVSILLAHVGAYRGFASFLGRLFYAEELWWMRLLVILGVIVGAFILHYITDLVEKQFRMSRRDSAEKKLKDEVANQEEFIKGLKQGTSLAK